MNASIAVAFDSSPASSGRHPGISSTIALTVLHRGRIVAADQHVGVDRLVDVSELGRREVVERGDDTAARHRGLHVGGHTAPRRHERLELLVRRARARWPSTRRPCRRARRSFSCAVPAAESHGVAMTMSSQSAAPALSPAVSRSASCGHLPTRSSTVSIARYFDREPMTTSWPMLASRAARPLPAGPVPPRIPMRMATAWHAHPVLVNSLRTRVCKKFTRTDEAIAP